MPSRLAFGATIAVLNVIIRRLKYPDAAYPANARVRYALGIFFLHAALPAQAPFGNTRLNPNPVRYAL